MPTDAPSQQSRRVLVADHSAEIVEMLTVLLEREGYEVLTARDGLTTLRLAAELRPDVIIMDISFADLDGCEVARRLRALPNGHRLRLVAHTGHPPERVVMGVQNGGFDVHLLKPVRTAAVLRTLDELLADPRGGD